MISFFSIYEISFPAVCVFISHYNRIILFCEYSMPFSFKRFREAFFSALCPWALFSRRLTGPGLIDGQWKKEYDIPETWSAGKTGR
ncbi:hypothetical protein DW097_25410 [Enterocloster clostridioformis]|nr:hypothetical protein [Enterocloster bolteae]RGB82048.1 hypothetical protein DW097_25410 [Enterocloster clostridioformis]